MASKYDGFVEEAPVENAALAQSMYAAKDVDTGRAGKVYELAKRKNLPVDFVERNYDDLSKPEGTDYSRFIESSPKLVEFLSDPENAKIAKDDADHLSKIETDINILDKTGGLVKSMAAGVYSFSSNLAKSPAMMPSLSKMITGDTFGQDPYEKDKIEHLLKNPVTDYLDSTAQDLKPQVPHESIVKSISQGNFYPLAVEISYNLPQVVLTAINPAAGLTLMGASAAGQKFEENIEKGVAPEKATASALISAGIETGIETVGGIGAGGKALKDIINSSIGTVGRQGTIQALKESFKLVRRHANEEGIEEGATALANAAVDWAMGIDNGAFDNILTKMADSYLVGAGAGGVVSSVGVLSKNISDYRENMVTAESSRIYTNLKEFVTESKLYKNSPTKMGEYIQKQAENTPVQDVYIDTQRFDEYFQSKKIDPIQAAKDLKIEKEYNLAKESGTDLKVETGKWTVNTASTEHYEGLADDVRFNQEALSKNELKQQQEDFKKESAELEKIAKEEGEKIQTAEQEGKEIIDDVYNQLVESGMSKAEAKQSASLYRAIPVLAERMGVSPKSLYKRFGLRIIKSDSNLQPEVEAMNLLSRDESGSYIHDEGVLRSMLVGMMEGKPGSRIPVEGTDRFVGVPSSFPKWFQDKGVKSQNVINIIRKKLEGKQLTAVQAAILDQMYEDAVDSTVRGELFQKGTASPTYSALIKAVTDKIPNNASPAQIMSTLKDLKAEEIEWSGIKSFLEGKEKVSKKELLDYLAANQVDIKDVTLRNKGDSLLTEAAINEKLAGTGYSVEQDFDGEFLILDSEGELADYDDLPENVKSVINQADSQADAEAKGEAPKYQNYTLPGGENYREVLFTLPVDRNEYQQFRKDMEKRYKSVDFENRLSPDEYEKFIELKQKYKEQGKDSGFKSSHFSQPNVLAHTRLTDRVDSDGKKVLFIEEIQSDWHQAGRKKGYKGDISPEKLSEIKKQQVKITDRALAVRLEIGELLKDQDNLGFDSKSQAINAVINNEDFDTRWDVSQEIAPKLKELREENRRLAREGSELMNLENRISQGVPNAPLKKTWHEFVLKRVIRMAAEGGYDKVAWTTGEQQAERFDLSKEIEELTWYPDDEDGNYGVVVANRKDGVEVLNKRVKSENLDDYVGKDLAKKLLEAPQDPDIGLVEAKTLKGIDLKIGGEGMKGFYDKILVDYAKKFGKKFGAEVGRSQIGVVDKANQDSDLKLLSDLGVEPTGSGALSVHSMTISPSLKETAINEGFSLFQSTMGSYSPKDRVIKLFQSSDRSTFLHESAHFFFDVMSELSKENVKIKNDFDKILKWVGNENPAEITREHHEKFARGFEAYLMEGKTPSAALRKAFNTFKVWLFEIYQGLAGLEKQAGFKINLNDEIRQVMDRLVASEEEINQAEMRLDFATLTIDPKFDTPEHKQLREEARLEAEAILNKKLLHDLEVKKSREYKEKFDSLVNKIKAELSKLPIYNAHSVLTKGKTTDGTVVERIKIDRKSVQDRMGVDAARNLDKKFTASDGLDYANVAEFFGYADAEQFIFELSETNDIDETARFQANEIIKRDFPDLYKSAEIKPEAMAAIHNEKKSLLLKYEYEWLFRNARGVFNETARRLIARSPIDQVVKAQAKKYVGMLDVKELKPHTYLRAERQASREAAKLFTQGDLEGALKAKRREYLNHEIYREVVNAQEQVEKFEKWVKRVFEKTEDLSKKRDIDLVNTARAILGQYGIGSDRNEDPLAYLAKVKTYDPAAYNALEAIVSDAIIGATALDDASYDKFVELKDTVEALWNMSKESKLIEIDGKKVSKETAVEELNNQIALHGTSAEKQIKMGLSDFEKFSAKVLSFKAALTRVETWADLMDLGKKGPFKKYIWNPVSEAAAVYRLEKTKVIKEYRKILEEYQDLFTDNTVTADNLLLNGKPAKFTKSQLLMAILHTGNLSNKSKLLRGYGFGTVNEDGSLNSTEWDTFISSAQANGILTEKDYQFAQKVWDLMESMKPGAQKAHKKMYGYYFNEITANAIETPWGTFRGGYIPAKVDAYTNEDAAIREERQELEKNNNSFMFPTTGRGFTKSRNDAYAAPLSLDMNLLGAHIDSVSRFSYLEPTIKDVGKIVIDKKFRAELAKIDSEIGKEMLMPWLQRAAQQKVVLPSDNGVGKLLDAVAGYLRTSVAMQVMFGNVTNSLQQLTGVIVAATKVQPVELKNAMGEYISNRKETLDLIYSKSNFMKANQGANIYESMQAIDKIVTNPTVFDNIREFSIAHTYFLQSATQDIVNSVVWLAAYNQALKSKESDVEAVRSADAAVRTTQGTVNAEDISRFETGTKTQRLFTQFATYFNMIANLSAAELMKISKTIGLKNGAGKAFYVYSMAFMLPAVLSQLIVMAMAGKLTDDEDDDGYLDEFFTAFFGSQFKTGTAMVPYVGPVLASAVNRFNDVTYDDRLTFSPVLSVLETGLGAPYRVIKGVNQDDIKKGAVKDTLMLVGMLSSLPVGPIGKPVGYLMDVNSGEADPTGPIDLTRGLISGQPGTQ